MDVATVEREAALHHLLGQAKVSVETNRRLLSETRYRVAASRRRLNPIFALSGSSGDGRRATVRERLASGALYPVDGYSWAGHGTGKPCAVCDSPVSAAEVEYEVANVVAHAICFMTWHEESEALRDRMTTEELLMALRGSKTDIGRYIEVMIRDQLPNLVVPAKAVQAWQQREPKTWTMVCDWIAAEGKSVVQR
jgi:hypothetical protein